MKKLLEIINSKTNWGKNELTLAINNVATENRKLAIAKQFSLRTDEHTKENIIMNTCLHLMAKIQAKNSWGSRELKDLLLMVLVEELDISNE
jgi:hypothetical protein